LRQFLSVRSLARALGVNARIGRIGSGNSLRNRLSACCASGVSNEKTGRDNEHSSAVPVNQLRSSGHKSAACHGGTGLEINAEDASWIHDISIMVNQT
jgi:hypothetical protein